VTDTSTEKKKVLLLQYSQSGQLSDVAAQFTQPLREHPSFDLHIENIKPVTPFPFPWPFFDFLDAFPESVYLDPPAIAPSSLMGDEDFDLIILAYQVWFLSPAMPTTAFLQSDVAKKLFKGKPVVTLIACRNMWLMAQEEVKTMLNNLDAQLVGNVALVDEAGSIGSFLATPVWVLSGKKGPHLGGLIPKAGVAPEQIKACDRFGKRIIEKMLAGSPLDDTLLQNLGAVNVNEKLIASEKTAKRGFRIWGKLLRSIGPRGSNKRKPVLIIYVSFLIFFILTFIPISMVLKALLAPLSGKKTAAQKAYFGAPSGS
jgi:hypothetical protein